MPAYRIVYVISNPYRGEKSLRGNLYPWLSLKKEKA